MTKINVLEAKHKKSGTSPKGIDWNIWAYKINDHTWVDSFDKLEAGQSYEGEIVKNANELYNDNFKLSKEQSKPSNNDDLKEINEKLDKIIARLFRPGEEDSGLPF